MKISLNVTYHEIMTFFGYIQVPSASANPGNMKKINPVFFFFF